MPASSRLSLGVIPVVPRTHGGTLQTAIRSRCSACFLRLLSRDPSPLAVIAELIAARARRTELRGDRMFSLAHRGRSKVSSCTSRSLHRCSVSHHLSTALLVSRATSRCACRIRLQILAFIVDAGNKKKISIWKLPVEATADISQPLAVEVTQRLLCSLRQRPHHRRCNLSSMSIQPGNSEDHKP